MNISRRNLARSAAATGLAAALPFSRAAAAAKYRLRYGTAFPHNHPAVTRIVEAADTIRKETNGDVDLQVFPDSQLGSEPDMFSQTRNGALDFMSTSGANQTVIPSAAINIIAFAFKNYDQVWAAMDGDLGNYVRAAFDKVGLYVMPKVLDNGFREITSSAKPILHPDDLQGFKIRVPGNPLWVTMFQALGAAPTPIDFGQLYAALQTHLVDGQENPLALIQSAKLYEVQKYVTLSNHIWDGHYIFANAHRWSSLPENTQQIIRAALTTAAERERNDITQFNQGAEAEMKKAGLTFNTIDAEPFRAILRAKGFYTTWKAKFGEDYWSRLEKYTGPL